MFYKKTFCQVNEPTPPGSDWVNGILQLLPGDVAWGTMTIAFSWGPALFGLYVLCVSVCRGGIKALVLLPIRFLLWPLLVPIGM